MSNDVVNTFVEARQLGKQVTTRDGMLTLLHDINFKIEAGTSVAILGASGSGKTTLLGLLAGLDTPTQGAVILDDNNLNDFDEDGRALLRAELVGFVFQNFQLLFGLTALENVMLPLELAQAPHPRKTAEELLARVGLADRAGDPVGQLSGGEMQRVAICRALLRNPPLLLADEPTGNLDENTSDAVLELMLQLVSETGAGLLLVTHSDRLASRLSRRLHLSQGRLA